ncbi:Cro/CI family transcriptional regulator [Psychrobacter sp. K31L]|uniref:Cro/CI family transcriptional regulator n=1 Tax=Psychrobacter sp. K31L TaxID=2820758 RepID=UPI001B31F3FA|nr:Cro/CI family transcriptional regulator [Psychrobacter sp. K31L]MBP3945147.1 hypothetical protein [Psychrobacter sp. K31L]
MTKNEALKVANGSVVELGRLLNISHNAISQWSDKKIPELREYQIKEIIDKREAEQLEEA